MIRIYSHPGSATLYMPNFSLGIWPFCFSIIPRKIGSGSAAKQYESVLLHCMKQEAMEKIKKISIDQSNK
jgi:hypothetical protein